MAVNCFVRPFATVGFAGVTLIDTKAALVTVRPVVPETAPLVAVMVAVPTPTVVANPYEPAALLTVAAPVLEEDQMTCVVRFRVVWSV